MAYTGRGDVVLAAYETTSPGSAIADPASERRLVEIAHPRSNHNGGMVAFGPDGYLYFSTGDGGGAGDPDRAGQDLLTLAGKILRIDVDTDTSDAYGIPPDNPFIALPSARSETWAYGLRNPWRFSFDRLTGDLWITDIGQAAVEEVDFQPAGSKGGENYGWSTVEGSSCFRPSENCKAEGLTPPVHTYGHDRGCSITGGYVYRGNAIPDLRGWYLYTDYCIGTLTALVIEKSGTARPVNIGSTPGSVSSFGEDDDGELYAVSDGEGTVSLVVPAP